MKSTKILFTDLDGTLLDDQKNISRHSLDTIKRMTDAGHKLVLCSGRPINSVLAVSEQFGFTGPGFYVVSYNGGLIYDCYEKKTILHSPLSFDCVKYLFDQAEQEGLHVHTYSDTHIISLHDTPELAHYCEHIKMPTLVTDDILGILDEEPMKLIVMDLNGRSRLEAFRAKLSSWAEGKVSSTFSSPVLLEYGSPVSSKGNAVKYLCEYLNIPIENSVAAGDEENDTTMLEVAGVGAAMANGIDITKNAADYITEHDNNHDGISEIIEKFILELSPN